MLAKDLNSQLSSLQEWYVNPFICILNLFARLIPHFSQEEGIFPHQRALASDGNGGASIDGSESPSMAEERRLAYVGFTRARDRLYLTHCTCRRIIGCRSPGRTGDGGPSRFLLAIPLELRQPVTMFGSPANDRHEVTDIGHIKHGWALRALVVLTRAGADYAAREALDEYGIESISWNQLEMVAVGGSCRPTAAATAAAIAASQLSSTRCGPLAGKRFQLESSYNTTPGQMAAVDSLVQGLESGLRFQASTKHLVSNEMY
jgi:hypothetical protein